VLRVFGIGGRRRTCLDAFKNVLPFCLGLDAQPDDSAVSEFNIDFDFGENLLGFFLSYYQIF